MLLLGYRYCTCLSRNSLASFSMCPSYRLVVRLIRPIFDKPKSVSLMCPMEVISRLFGERKQAFNRLTFMKLKFWHTAIQSINNGECGYFESFVVVTGCHLLFSIGCHSQEGRSYIIHQGRVLVLQMYAQSNFSLRL